MKKSFFLISTSLIFSYSSFVSTLHAACSWSYDASKTHIQWKAFKTNKKIGVDGNFTSFEIKNAPSSEEIVNVFNKATFIIDSTKIDTKNAARDQSISKNFFKKWKSKGKISGNVADFNKQTDQSGNFLLVLDMNGSKSSVPMQYNLIDGSKLEAKGIFNVLDFDLGDALKSLNKACKALHAPGGTWADVEILLVSELTKKCD